nr:SNF2 helicase-associated domain-containing protein [Paenibacillus hemerocallicola]
MATLPNANSRQLLSDGWNVMLPGWWEAASKRKPRLRAQVTPDVGGRGQSLFGLNALVDFDWRIAIGDADLNDSVAVPAWSSSSGFPRLSNLPKRWP